MKIDVFNETKHKIKKELIQNVQSVFTKKGFKEQSCNLIIHEGVEIKKLNKELFGKNNSTDVISVQNPLYKEEKDISIGDVYICMEVIKMNALEFKVDLDEETVRIIVHGILHLLGHDHLKPFGESKEKMFDLQEELTREVIKNI